MPEPRIDLPRRCLLGLIRLYQLAISPYLGRNCRFYPCCSRYAMEAIDRYGALKGTALSVTRIARCHPWNEGGYDPVPEAMPGRERA
ncbi:MAG: membrane protein insertion efficiency factor YidD [Gammaproteobacteria bacterium]|nr:membrane protein insertion efficiency factor YidD [Gammaproteobacteria bacterium]MYD76348.1 membrane protein insertion efficiency factor YidD [Gammaproteobacteria bacterium]MYJ51190.1 membrane protein insertion efficiency factor YidD [Gammaproteobacteria bacterium]